MMNSRWQANKIGLINFWYYDEQEFPFVKGRMLLLRFQTDRENQ